MQEQKFILWKGRQRRGRRRSPRTRHRWRGLRGAPPSASPPSPPCQKPIPDRIKLSDGSKEGAKESNDASSKRNWESVEPRLPGIGEEEDALQHFAALRRPTRWRPGRGPGSGGDDDGQPGRSGKAEVNGTGKAGRAGADAVRALLFFIFLYSFFSFDFLF